MVKLNVDVNKVNKVDVQKNKSTYYKESMKPKKDRIEIKVSSQKNSLNAQLCQKNIKVKSANVSSSSSLSRSKSKTNLVGLKPLRFSQDVPFDKKLTELSKNLNSYPIRKSSEVKTLNNFGKSTSSKALSIKASLNSQFGSKEAVRKNSVGLQPNKAPK